MTLLRSTLLGLSVLVSLGSGWGQGAYGQPLSPGARLDRAICLQQWEQALDIASELIATPEISATERQELLQFRRQLQSWRLSPAPAEIQASCDRTLSLFLPLETPAPSAPAPLDWNRALATLANPGPIIVLDDGEEPTADLIPADLMAASPEILANWHTPIDTTDGFNVVGGQINGGQQVYSFLARTGDSLNLELDVTRMYLGVGQPQLFLIDRSGRPWAHSEPNNFQTLTQNLVVPETDVYFVVVAPPETVPILDIQNRVVGWQHNQTSRFDYTLTLTGVTPYQALLPDGWP